jgi:hypothetical protein
MVVAVGRGWLLHGAEGGAVDVRLVPGGGGWLCSGLWCEGE